MCCMLSGHTVVGYCFVLHSYCLCLLLSCFDAASYFVRRDVRSSLDPAFFLLVLPDEMLVTHVSGWFFSMFDGR